MATSTGGRERNVCGTCDLPYYVDAGECPYCETASGEPAVDSTGGPPGDRVDEEGFVFGTGSSARSRTTCSTCGLPYYEDVDRCPYCEFAGAVRAIATGADADASEAGDAAAGVEADAADGASEGTAIDANAESAGPSAGEERPGLFGRLKRALGL